MAAADIALSPAAEASEPPEARGLKRDEVRLLVSDVETGSIEHARFRDLSRSLQPGDLLVVNTSATLNAALSATSMDGEAFEVHLSTRLPGGFWTAELRRASTNGASLPFRDARPGQTLHLSSDAELTLLAPYPNGGPATVGSRLWLAALRVPSTVEAFLARHGFPIRYKYTSRAWPNSAYQTVFAIEPGSAEMPSAGRPFTPDLVTHLIARGVHIAPLVLHTGVSSLESGEPPYEEYFRVPRDTALQVNAARRSGHHVIAVGTTVIRALETVTDERGTTHPGSGWTNLIITPDHAVRSVSGLITGWHEPNSSHLMLIEQVLEAVSPSHGEPARIHLARAYDEARREGYLWHEFGDSHLILGRARPVETNRR